MTWVPEAVIFDMDGVLINSEPLWRRAMVKGFGESGMVVSEDECRQTMGMRIAEVVKLWLHRFNQPASSSDLIELRIMDVLLELIEREGRALDGVHELLDFCEAKKLKCGLATSSSVRLMKAVLARLGLQKKFSATISAERLRYGKPHPEVFLLCAENLKCHPQKCLVIEDSLNGVIAAKAASMTVIAVPDDDYLHADVLRQKQFSLADERAEKMADVQGIIRRRYFNENITA